MEGQLLGPLLSDSFMSDTTCTIRQIRYHHFFEAVPCVANYHLLTHDGGKLYHKAVLYPRSVGPSEEASLKSIALYFLFGNQNAVESFAV